jgi:hypothetical protein
MRAIIHLRNAFALLRTPAKPGLAIVALAACGGSSPETIDAAVTIDAVPDAAVNMTTSLVVDMMQTRTLNLGIYGVNADDGTLHVEVNLGGVTTCPDMNSPTPDYTLILGRVPSMTAATATSPGNFLDYQGDMLGGPLGQAATSVSLSNVVYTAGTFVALDAMVTFPAGTAMGHVYAKYCASLDG